MEKKHNSLNTFKGKNAIIDYLNPDKNDYIPLVELPESCNPLYNEKVKIFAKLLNTLPLTNVKSFPAFNMLNEAKKEGKLDKVHTLIENSSGNTVFSIAVLGRLLGIPNTKAFVSNEVLYGKLQLLKLFGVEILVNEEPICPDPEDKTSGIYKAKRLGNQEGWFNAGQYENEANPKSHEKWTGKQIWEQTKGNVNLFCAGLGTTGTMVGSARYLKNKNVNIKTIGVIRTPNNPVPGVRTRGLLNMIAFNWKNYTDHVEEVGTKDSFENSLMLIRHGLVVGPSSGFALAGLINFLQKQREKGCLDQFRGKDGEINAVFICCDSPYPYLDEYFNYLDESHFPKIENEHLILDKPNKERKININTEEYELSPINSFNIIYPNPKEEVWNLLENGKKIKTKSGIVILDIRSKQEFDHFHLPSSTNIEYLKILKRLTKEAKSLKNKKVLVICNLGLRSSSITSLLRKKGIEAYNIQGGITEWSNLNLPRWKPDICFRK